MQTSHVRRWATAIIAGLVIVGAAQFSGAGADSSPAPASTGLVFSVAPYTEAGALPRGDFTYDVAAGQDFTDRVVVKNLGDQPKPLYVYVAQVYNAEAGGALAVRERTDTVTDAATWVRLGGVPTQTPLTIPPRSEDIINVVVAVPADATPGDHTAAIIAEELPPPGTVEHGAGVKTVHRIGAQLRIRVVGPITAALQVTKFKIVRHVPVVPFITGTGSTSITFTLVNSGNVRVQLDKAGFEMTGLFGRTLHHFSLNKLGAGQAQSTGLPEEILPGSSIAFARTFRGLPPIDIITGKVSVTGEDPVAHHSIATARSGRFFAIPWLPGLVVLVLAAAYVVWRRRGGGDDLGQPVAAEVPIRT